MGKIEVKTKILIESVNICAESREITHKTAHNNSVNESDHGTRLGPRSAFLRTFFESKGGQRAYFPTRETL